MTNESPKRLDSRLEATGAEFLVLGLLLVEGIQASKAYVNFPGYDIIATDPERGTSVRLQVKSRWATDYDGGFLIGNFDTDFVAFVELNRGFRYRRKRNPDADGRKPPRVFVFPVAVVREAQSKTSTWGKVFLRSIENVESYVDRWELVSEALRRPVRARVRASVARGGASLDSPGGRVRSACGWRAGSPRTSSRCSRR